MQATASKKSPAAAEDVKVPARTHPAKVATIVDAEEELGGTYHARAEERRARVRLRILTIHLDPALTASSPQTSTSSKKRRRTRAQVPPSLVGMSPPVRTLRHGEAVANQGY